MNVAGHYPLPSHDLAEVRCRPQISRGRAGTIALPLERGGELGPLRKCLSSFDAEK